MSYRITSTSPAGATRVVADEPFEALNVARMAQLEGRDDVWISDPDGKLFTIREFERYLNGFR